MTRFTLFTLLTASSSIFFAPSLIAADTNIEEVIVTATRSDKNIADVAPSTIVITRTDIENAQAFDLAELLQFQAGLDIGRNGGPGQTTSVFIRGTESNHTLVLVDGVEVNPGSIGGAAIQNISPEVIERIEIVKGARSSLYGSEAIGGVINIITRDGRDKTSIETSIGYGKYDTKNVSAQTSYRENDRFANFGINWKDTDGFSTKESATGDRGHSNLSVNFKGGLHLFGTDLELQHWQSNGETEYFDFSNNPVSQDFTNTTTSFKATKQINDAWNSQLTLANSTDEIEQNQLNPFTLQNDFAKTDRNSLDWFNNYALQSNTTLLGGIYWSREEVDALSFGTGFFDPTEVKAIYTGAETKFGSLSTFANVRFTDHDTAGSQVSWNLDAQYPINNTFKLNFSAGEAFREPDGTDRFGFGGNPNLKTEESLSISAALDASTNYGDFRLEAYQNDIDNLIDFVFTDFVTFSGENRNIAEAKIQGVELNHKYNWNNFQFNTTALVQSPKDETNGSDLARRARRSLTTNVNYLLGEHNLGLQLLASSQRKDSGFSDTINAGYVLANLTGKYQVNDRIALFGKFENLLDTDYQTAAGFNQSGRAFYLNMRLKY